jgi:hypothetical protein
VVEIIGLLVEAVVAHITEHIHLQQGLLVVVQVVLLLVLVMEVLIQIIQVQVH